MEVGRECRDGRVAGEVLGRERMRRTGQAVGRARREEAKRCGPVPGRWAAGRERPDEKGAYDSNNESDKAILCTLQAPDG